MRDVGPVWGIDVGGRMGVAAGNPGDRPWSAAVVLKQRGEPADVAYGNLIAFLNEKWNPALGGVIPRLVAIEAQPNLAAFAPKKDEDGKMKHFSNADAIAALYGYHAIVRGMAQRFGVPVEAGHDATIRKHFLGKGRLGSREETKHAVVLRCQQLQYFGRDKYDDNRADACATWDWACATHCRTPPKELHMFRENPR